MTGLLDDFADLLPDKIGIAPVATRNGFGEDTYASPVTYDGRVVFKAVKRRSANGTEFTSPFSIIIATSARISLNSKVTIPNDPATYLVGSVDYFRDEANLPHHATLYVEP